MKKVFLLFLLLFCIAGAEDYRVPNFKGGMNLVNGDSVNLAPNEAISICNMVLNGDVLESRHGYSVWNATAIDTINEVTNCFVYQPTSTTYRMVVSAGHYHLYKTTSLAAASNWSDVAFKIADTGYVDDETLFVASDIWPRLKTAMWDSVYLKCSPDSSLTIDNSFSVNDTAIILSKNSGVDDSSNVYFEIWCTSVTPSFAQYKDKLYISGAYQASAGGRFSMAYDDTDYTLLGVIDTGVVSDTIDIQDTSTIIFNEGYAHIKRNSNKVKIMGPNANNIPSVTGVEKGMIFVIENGPYPDGERRYNWQSVIDSVYADTITPYSPSIDTAIYWYLELEDLHPEVYHGYYGHYEIRRDYWACGFASYAIEDSNKNWLDIDYASGFLQAMYLQPANSDTVYDIYCNGENYVAINGNLEPEDRYYVYSMLPYYLLITSEDYTQFPYLDQIIFNKERLWAIGNNYSKYQVGQGQWINTRGDVNTVWYSDPAYPEYIKYNYNFSVGNNERLTCVFELRGDLYFASANAIWRAGSNIGDMYKIANVGFSDKKSMAVDNDNLAYFANDDGIFVFNGTRADKVSRNEDFNIEPFHDKFKQSQIVMGYKNDILYVSYPDSIDSTTHANYPNGVTLRIDIDNRFWSYFDFGMNFIMMDWADKDTSIFLFGHPNYPGRIFYYPNSMYSDSLSTGSAVPTCTYETGWQDLGAMNDPNLRTTVKVINSVTMPMQVPGQATVYIYSTGINPVDFSTTVADSFVTDKTGNYIFTKYPYRCVGEYFKFKVKTSSGTKFVLRPYGVNWSWYFPKSNQ